MFPGNQMFMQKIQEELGNNGSITTWVEGEENQNLVLKWSEGDSQIKYKISVHQVESMLSLMTLAELFISFIKAWRKLREVDDVKVLLGDLPVKKPIGILKGLDMKNKSVGCTKTPISEKIHPAGFYLLRVEEWTNPDGDSANIESAYTMEGYYIGPPHMAYELVTNWGVVQFDRSKETNTIANIGFSFRDRKWYGWDESHIQGFGIGDVIFEDTTTKWFDLNDDEKPKTRRINSLDEAKEEAIKYVSMLSEDIA